MTADTCTVPAPTAAPARAAAPQTCALRRRDGTHAVVVTGIGLATPLGDSISAFTRRLFAGAGTVETLGTRYAAPVPGMRARVDATPSSGDRVVQLAAAAGRRALEDAGWSEGADGWRACGVFVGTSCGPTETVGRSYARLHEHGRVPPLTLLHCMPGAAAAHLALHHGLQGPSQTLTAACASSTIAIGEGLRAVRHGYVDRVLVGGTEAPFSDGTVKAWEALRMLAPAGDDAARACRPFDRHRRGLLLAEGAAFFVLESATSAAARGVAAHAVLLGYGNASDAHHWTEPSAAGQVLAMRQALADAQVAASDVQLVNAYASGTQLGDCVEAHAIARVFGSGPDAPWVHSTKSIHGHALGASGALELMAVIACLNAGHAPPTRNLDEPDALPLRLVWREPRPLRPGAVALSNSFAFGGSNACLVVGTA